MRHKLHLTEQYIRNKGIHKYAKKDADKIKLCINLLDRLIKDEYHIMAFKDVDKKWGDIEMSFTSCEDNPEFSQLHITRPGIKTEKDKIQEKKEFKLACEHEQYLINQDLEYLFKKMNKHIQGWWD